MENIMKQGKANATSKRASRITADELYKEDSLVNILASMNRARSFLNAALSIPTEGDAVTLGALRCTLIEVITEVERARLWLEGADSFEDAAIDTIVMELDAMQDIGEGMLAHIKAAYGKEG